MLDWLTDRSSVMNCSKDQKSLNLGVKSQHRPIANFDHTHDLKTGCDDCYLWNEFQSQPSPTIYYTNGETLEG